MASTDTARELAALTSQLEELNRIGAALSAERDMGRLLDMILTKARAITSADAGSLYIVETIDDPGTTPKGRATEQRRTGERRRLRFKYAQNDSVSSPFRETVLDLDDRSIAGSVALSGKAVNLSASDRPYKKAVPIERALEILGFAVKNGELDPDLFRAFVEARVFDRWKIEPHPY